MTKTSSTPSLETMITSALLELGELRYRVGQLEQSRITTSPTSGQTRAMWDLIDRAVRLGPQLVHFAIWLAPKLAMLFGLLTAYFNGTIHAALRFLLAHL